VETLLLPNVKFSCGLFNDALVTSDYTALNNLMINDLVGKDMEGSGRGLI
jgi:hypothetical protein